MNPSRTRCWDGECCIHNTCIFIHKTPIFTTARYPHNQHHGYDKLPTPRKLKSQQLPVRMTNFTQLSSCEVFRYGACGWKFLRGVMRASAAAADNTRQGTVPE